MRAVNADESVVFVFGEVCGYVGSPFRLRAPRFADDTTGAPYDLVPQGSPLISPDPGSPNPESRIPTPGSRPPDPDPRPQ